MLVVCRREAPTLPDARRLGRHYRAGEQQFPVVVGERYRVYGLRFWVGAPWVDIETNLGYLLTVPLALFDVVDGKVPDIWELRVDAEGDIALLPMAFFDEYFFDDLFEGKAAAVLEFRRVKATLEERDSAPNEP